MWVAAFQVPFWCFDVAMRYFEEIFSDFKKKTERFDNGCVVQCEQLAVNVCGAAEAPKEQTGKWMASKSSLTNVSRKVTIQHF